MDLQKAAQQAAGYTTWRLRVDELVRSETGRDLVELERAAGELPLALGWESGDSPEEFVAGALLPLLEAL
jgi:hypothetical protein